jgi:GTP-binding protein HflX
VGFVKHLPHDLIDAFKSTLEEVSGADVIVHVVDGSHPDPLGQIAAVRGVIKDIGGEKIPEIIAINKVEIADQETIREIMRSEPDAYPISIHTGIGIEKLIAAIEASLPRPKVEVRVLLPYNQGHLVNRIHEEGEILSEIYEGDGTALHALVDEGLYAALKQYSVTSS